jgi:exodeoxyribonuclease V alpha subunit
MIEQPSLPASVTCLDAALAAGLLDAIDVHLAAALVRLGNLGDRADPAVVFAIALASRAPRHGHVCVDLDTVAHTAVTEGHTFTAATALGADPVSIAWPESQAWAAALSASSSIVAPSDADIDDLRPLVLDGRRLYLDRLWRDERSVAEQLLRRAGLQVEDWGASMPEHIDRLFPPADSPDGPEGPDGQRLAACTILQRALTVVAGGPGTGKTRTIARLLSLLDTRPGRPLRVALAAPTGKAAARMGEALRSELAIMGTTHGPMTELQPTTLHRLLGMGGRRRTVDQIDHDLVIVDESSMVSLPMMAQLLRSLADHTRLVLVGDPDQLASIEAGSVLADIIAGDGRLRTGPLAHAIVYLQRSYRFMSGSGVRPLAAAIREGDLSTIRQLFADEPTLTFINHDDPSSSATGAGLRPLLVAGAARTVRFAAQGDASGALGSTRFLRLLCAHRSGPTGVDTWNRLVERWLAHDEPDCRTDDPWYVGRPVLITRNDPVTRLSNGDVGVVLSTGDGHRVVAIERADGIAQFGVVQLPDNETVHAMTIHKSQGSEFDHVVVLLPDVASQLCTRELLYTAVTRTRRELTVVGTWAALDAAIGRRIARSSGLADALWPR